MLSLNSIKHCFFQNHWTLHDSGTSSFPDIARHIRRASGQDNVRRPSERGPSSAAHFGRVPCERGSGVCARRRPIC